MKTLTLDKAPIFPGAETLNAKSFTDSNSFGIVHFTLKPGGFIPEHNMPFEVCFLILRGEGTLKVNERSYNLVADSIAVCQTETRRSWRNMSREKDLMILSLKMKCSKEEEEGNKLEIRQISDQKPAPNPHNVDVRRVYDSEHAMASIITFRPGEKLIRHITPVDVFFYVLEGTGVVEVGDEKETVTSDTVIESPKDIPHCWYNESNAVLRVLVVKIPKPTTSSQML